MDRRLRELVFEPLRTGSLSAIVPDFSVELDKHKVEAATQLTREGDGFQLLMHFAGSAPPEAIRPARGGFFSQADCLVGCGQINGEIAFRCTDLFPPSQMTTRSRGTSTVVFHSSRLHLVAEGTDAMTSAQVHSLLGSHPSHAKSCRAHLIFHGPRLVLEDSGTETTSKNDFLGEATRSSADTHQFRGLGWEGALIQEGAELHLHVRSEAEPAVSSADAATDLIDRVAQAAAFVLGFQPWPAYREVRLDHVVLERWVSPRFDLPTNYLVPVSGAAWDHFRAEPQNPIHSIISTIADGLGRLSQQERSRLTTLLWHFRSGNIGELPSSTRLLILCAVIDGLMKLIAGFNDPKEKPATDRTWRAAAKAVGLAWDEWMKSVFELWGKHRHLLSHGWLWVEEDKPAADFFGTIRGSAVRS